MFLTSKEMHINLPQDLVEEGWHQWHTITQVLPTRWFHLRYFTADLSTEHTLMTVDLDVVQDINTDPSFSLVNVSLVSPPHMNGTEEWTLSPLSSIVTLIMKDGEAERLLGYEYCLKAGCRIPEYLGGLGSNGGSNVIHNEIVFNYMPLQANPAYAQN